MGNDRGKIRDETWIGDLSLTSENIGFKPEEMKACAKCGKSNPPTRSKCFYCSKDLEINAHGTPSAKLNIRVLENWEKGFNVIYLPEKAKGKPDVSTAARFLSMEADSLKQVIEAKSVIPLARLALLDEASAAVQFLGRLGMECSVIGDDLLESDRLPVRLRGLKFDGDNLILTIFNTNDEVSFRRHDILLLVTGALIEAKIEVVEKRKKKESSVVLETQTLSDGGLIDFYASGDSIGYRIPFSGFDFSCLGADKVLLAAENIRRLAEVLRTFAPSAKFVGDYLMVRQMLNTVWPIERRKDSSGPQGSGFGGKDFTKIESSNNLRQFTKYSRLQRQLL